MAPQNSNTVEDAFVAVERVGANLPPHVKLILKKMGINSLLGLSMLTEDTLSKIESSVKTLLASENRLSKMSEEDKVNLFGDFFSEDPQNFEFLPGERVEIFAAGQAAVLLLELKNKELNSELNNNKRKSDEDMEDNGKKKKKASLSEFLSESFSRKKKFKNLLCSYDDLEVLLDSDMVKCRLCPELVPMKVTKDRSGHWKPTTLYNHLKTRHCEKISISNEAPLKERTDVTEPESPPQPPSTHETINEYDGVRFERIYSN